MLSYRHTCHAGNFADVLKHSLLVHTLEYMTQKDKPLRIIDTHAGAGSYRLTDRDGLKNREYDHGIGKLWNRQDLPGLLEGYVAQIRAFNTQASLSRYPGSPLLAQALMRREDRWYGFEMHSTDFRLLRTALAGDRRIRLLDEDGFQQLSGLLPPPERRGLVLIDPSYEIKSDYQQVVKALQQAHRRFTTGTYALWYPVVQRQRIDELERSLQKSGISNIQQFELGVQADSADYGMTASGMMVINPPWTLWAAMQSALPWLAENLGRNGEGFFRQVQLVNE